MKCPVCTDTELVMSERQNVEIDYCPKCRGVWLDRGELDKIIERGTQEAPVAAMPPQSRGGPQGAPQPGYRPEHRPEYRSDHGYESRGHYKGKRRKSWLEEIFD